MSSVVLFIAEEDQPVELHPGKEVENPFGTSQETDFVKIGIGEKGSGFILVTHTVFNDIHQALVTVHSLVNDRFEQPLDTGLDDGEEVEVVVKGKNLRFLHTKEQMT